MQFSRGLSLAVCGARWCTLSVKTPPSSPPPGPPGAQGPSAPAAAAVVSATTRDPHSGPQPTGQGSAGGAVPEGWAGLRAAVPSHLGWCTRHGAGSHTTRASICSLESAPLTHVVPARVTDHLCIALVKFSRWLADRLFRDRYLHRGTMLKTIAPAPPFAAAMVDQLRNIAAAQPSRTARVMLAQAENHQMHLALLMLIVRPTRGERAAIMLAQTVHFCVFFVLFALSPRLGHRLLGYAGEEAAVLLTHMVNDTDSGKVPDVLDDGVAAAASVLWNVSLAPTDGEASLTLRDVALLMRADEMDHRDAHHSLADALQAKQLLKKAKTSSPETPFE